jgi:acyl transferase domain-containing protein
VVSYGFGDVVTTLMMTDYAMMGNRDPEDRPDSATIGVAWSILSNRISHFLNIHGPR